jgi:hypothetical protein
MRHLARVVLALLACVAAYAQASPGFDAVDRPPALIGFAASTGGFGFVYDGKLYSHSPLFGVSEEFFDMLAGNPASSALALEARDAMRLGAWIAVPSGIVAVAGGVGLGVCALQLSLSLFNIIFGGEPWLPPEWLVWSSIGAAALGAGGSIAGSIEMRRGYALGFDAVDAWNRAAFGASR